MEGEGAKSANISGIFHLNSSVIGHVPADEKLGRERLKTK